MILTYDEASVLNKVAERTKSDWFLLSPGDDGEDYVYDLTESCDLTLQEGVSKLMDEISGREDYDDCNLSEDEDFVLRELLKKLNIDF